MRTQRTLVLLTSLALLLSVTASTVTAATAKSVGVKTTQKVQRLGTTRITGAAPKAGDPSALAGEVRPDPELTAAKDSRKIGSPSSDSRVPSAFVPRPAAQPVVDASGATTQFAGITHRDQRTAGTGDYVNTQFSLEPPDQGLCVGNGFVVETVNTVVRVRSTSGTILRVAMPINDFFHLAPEFVRPTGPFGDFTTDPKCYFDTAANRWFVTALQIDVVPGTGDFAPGSHLYFAVSATWDPTGSWNLFSIDVTNDGTGDLPSHPNCPCFGDQPLIGADANGFYITTNEYPLFVPGFNGANVYAMSKSALAGGSLGTVTAFYEPTLAEGQAYSLQPTTTPPTGSFAIANRGTEYFLSALEFTGGLDNRIALWSLTNTASLSSHTPDPTMNVSIVDSEVYGLPAAMQQKAGSAPLADLIKSKYAPSVLGVKSTPVPIAPINSNDDRMNQAIYLDGHVWGALNTRMKSPTGAIRTGIAWFDVNTAGATMASQGYVAVQNDNVVFPSVAANASGDVLVAFTLLGQDYYPSAAYQWLHHATGTGAVRVVKWGNGPQDGFTGYLPEDPADGGIARWGDYSAAVADGSGNFWFATETINQSCSFSTFLSDTSCGGTRTILANWGTTIGMVLR